MRSKIRIDALRYLDQYNMMKKIDLIKTCFFASFIALGACEPRDPIQEGTRVRLDQVTSDGLSSQSVNSNVQLGAIVQRSWPQHLGSGSHQSINAAFDGTPNLIASIPVLDTGSEFNFFNQDSLAVASQPIIENGIIYYYGSDGILNAISASGQLLWRKSLIPSGLNAGEGYGGGIAKSGNRLYVSTGFGEVLAVDAGSGNILWRYVQNDPIRKPPLLAGGLVIVTSGGSSAVALNTSDGTVKWRNFADPSRVPTRFNAGVPATDGSSAVLTYATGAVNTVSLGSGQQLWNKSAISDAFVGANSLNAEVTGDPIIERGTVYLGTPAGVVSLGAQTGQVNWTQRVGTKGPLIVSGNSIFGITPSNQVYRLARDSGAVAFRAELPKFRNERLSLGRIGYSDIRLANNGLWVVDDRGVLFRLSAQNGQLTNQYDLGTPIAGSPIFAEGLMVVVTKSGALQVYR